MGKFTGMPAETAPASAPATPLWEVPAAAAAALGVTAVAVVLAVLLPGVALVLPAMLVLALHAVHRSLVVPRT
jgi:hypothetical protein